MFSAHATSAATHTPAATGGVVALLAPTPPQPLMVQVSTVQATSAAVPPPATGGIIALPIKAAVFLRKQPEYGSADFGEQIAELKALGAAWGPVTKVFADTPARIVQGAKEWYIPQGWPANSDAFLAKYASVQPAGIVSQKLLVQFNTWRANGSPSGMCYGTCVYHRALGVEKAVACSLLALDLTHTYNLAGGRKYWQRSLITTRTRRL